MKQYVTFGQSHCHRINGVTFDADCIAVFTAPDAISGRDKAFELFGLKFCMRYTEEEFDLAVLPSLDLGYFPRGTIRVPI